MADTKPYPENPSKSQEFEAFLKTLKKGTTEHWVQIATVLGVSRDTITQWKKHPLAQEAIREGIKRSFQNMEKAGRKDWKMWEAKLKLVGIMATEKIDVTSDGEKIQPILGGQSNGILSNDSNKEATPTPEEN